MKRVSNPIVLCYALLILLFHVKPVSIDVIPLPRGDLGRQAVRKPRLIRFAIARYALMFDPHHEIDLVLSLYPSLCASVTTTTELFHMLLNPLIHDN